MRRVELYKITVPDKKYPSIFGKQMLVAGVNNTAVKFSSNAKIYRFSKIIQGDWLDACLGWVDFDL